MAKKIISCHEKDKKVIFFKYYSYIDLSKCNVTESQV